MTVRSNSTIMIDAKAEFKICNNNNCNKGASIAHSKRSRPRTQNKIEKEQNQPRARMWIRFLIQLSETGFRIEDGEMCANAQCERCGSTRSTTRKVGAMHCYYLFQRVCL